MQFSKFIAAAATLAIAVAKVEFTNTAFAGIVAGKPFTITWQGATAPVTLKLKTGPSTAQTFVSDIASGLTATSFTWTPDTTLPDATYNLEIDSGSDVNYSIPFEVTGGTGTTSTLGSSVSSSVASTGSSSATSSPASTSSSPSSSSAQTSSTAPTSSSSSSSKSSESSTSTKASSTAPATSVPTSNSASQHGSNFALVIMGALAIASLN